MFITCQLIIKQLYEPLKITKKVHHALSYFYLNGKLEFLNAHTKVLKCNSYGFHNFYNFKMLIVMSSNEDNKYKLNKKVQRIFSSGLDAILQLIFTNIIRQSDSFFYDYYLYLILFFYKIYNPLNLVKMPLLLIPKPILVYQFELIVYHDFLVSLLGVLLLFLQIYLG